VQLQLRDSLPFATIELVYNGQTLEIPNVLIDTGSGGTLLAADAVAQIGVVPRADDVLHTIRGVGGSEVVFIRAIEQLKVGKFALSNFEVEIGGMDYGFDIRGILGMDFLTAAGAQIDLKNLTIEFQN